jgi:hypothetical protein
MHGQAIQRQVLEARGDPLEDSTFATVVAAVMTAAPNWEWSSSITAV